MDASPRHELRGQLGSRIAAAMLLIVCLNAWLQAARDLLGIDQNPRALTLLQLASGGTALLAAIGSWQRQPWTPAPTVLYGIVTGTMIIAVGPLLGLSAEERGGLPLGAGIVLATSLALAWYLRTITRTPTAR